MGGFTGFLSGLTLTSAALYLTLQVHQRNRVGQSRSLRQQALILNSLVEPELVQSEPRPQFAAIRPSWTETWKDRWNAEVEGGVRRVQEIDWEAVRTGVEGRIRTWREEVKK